MEVLVDFCNVGLSLVRDGRAVAICFILTSPSLPGRRQNGSVGRDHPEEVVKPETRLWLVFRSIIRSIF